MKYTERTGTNQGDRTSLWSRHEQFLFAAMVLLGALGLYSLDWSYSLTANNIYNLKGGVSTVGAERVLSGEIPYRDFWTMYAPGHFYLLAFLFRIFGTHLMVEVVAASVLCAAAALVCYWLVVNLTGRRFLAVACAAVFVASTYHTGYFKRLGSYPLAILFVFIALNFSVLYLKRRAIGFLISAGLATGTLIIAKHDVGGYTAIAIIAGLIAYHFLEPTTREEGATALLLKLVAYSASVALVVLPVLIYFAITAGPDMLQNLIVFPLTDFRYARPEGYPSLLPLDIYDQSPVMMMRKLSDYLNFTVPFALFVLGLAATGLAALRHRPAYAALGVTLSVGFLLHYSAAHIQINTHIITLSVYAAWLGVIFYDLAEPRFPGRRARLVYLFVSALIVGWLLSLMAQPIYLGWRKWRFATAELQIPKVSGFKVTPEVAHTLEELSAFVDTHIPPDDKLFVGLHRHDVIVIGDVMIYFVLDRPHATRYQELHPAITDTAPRQQEIVADLVENDVSFIILKQMFPDETLERVKKNFLKNLPQIGATDLDDYIRENYAKVRSIGPYDVWERRID